MNPEPPRIRKHRLVSLFGYAIFGTTALLVTGAYFLSKHSTHETASVMQAASVSAEELPSHPKKDSAAIAAAKARLELAVHHSDLDAMFLALRELQALGDDSQGVAERLAQVEKCIPLLQKIRVYQSDHNHEETVKVAGKFLDYFPDHPEARRALKESGLIFAYLEKALKALKGCFEQDSLGVRLIRKMGDDPSEQEDMDISRVFFQLSIAEKALADAIKLDPQFERGLSVGKVVSDTKNTLGYLVASVLSKHDAIYADEIGRAFAGIYSFMEKFVESRAGSPSDAWKKVAQAFEENQAMIDSSIAKLDEFSSFLQQFKGPGTPELIQIAREFHAKTIQLKDRIFNPTGSMIEYRRDVSTKQLELLELARKMSSSSTNSNELRENINGFGTAIQAFGLFNTPSETKPILEKYKNLIST